MRVIAFGLLIVYHVGMFYVAEWDWHIKSPNTSERLQALMFLTNPWRMSLLFLISGMALRFACQSISPAQLVRIRNRRLFRPLVFGMLVVVSPQVYIELLTKEGMAAGYLGFMTEYLNPATDAYPQHQHSPLGLLTWNHLWFLAYLWIYTFIFVVFKPLLDRASDALRQWNTPSWCLLLVPILLFTAYRQFLSDAYPPSNALLGDWYNHARYLTSLFGGYVLAQSPSLWRFLERNASRLLFAAGAAYLLLLGVTGGYLEAALWMLPDALVNLLARFVVSADQWLWTLAVLGLAKRYLNRPSVVLRYMNEAILPWYMLHQTFIVVLAYLLLKRDLAQPIEAMLLIVGTVAGCALGYEILRRLTLGRLLFGLGRPAQAAKVARPR